MAIPRLGGRTGRTARSLAVGETTAWRPFRRVNLALRFRSGGRNRAGEPSPSRTLHGLCIHARAAPKGLRRLSEAARFLLPNFGIGVANGCRHTVHVQGGQPRHGREAGRETVHLLTVDGALAAIRKKRSDGTFQLIVEVGDRRSERKIPAEIAGNPRSAEFARAVGEMKAELLNRRKGYRPN